MKKAILGFIIGILAAHGAADLYENTTISYGKQPYDKAGFNAIIEANAPIESLAIDAGEL